MPVNRKSVAPSNTAGALPGTPTLNDIAEEIEALWRYAAVPLSAVAGTANAITANCDVPLLVREKGNRFSLIPVAANTGGVTVSINGLGAKSLLNRDGTALAAGRLQAGRLESFEDTGSAYVLLTEKPVSSSAPAQSLYAYQTATNTNGQTIAAGWQDVPLNTTVLSEIPGATFPSPPQVSLAAGTYEVDAFCTVRASGRVALHIWDLNTSAPVTTGLARAQTDNYGLLRVMGKLTVPTLRNYTLRLYANSAGGNIGLFANITSPASVPEQFAALSLKAYA
jgi:hypothetical protein